MFNNFTANRSFLNIFIIYVVVSLVFVLVVRNYTANQFSREAVKVQSHISSMVDIRSGAVNSWIRAKDSSIFAVSENLTVKMFLASLLDKATSQDDILTQEQFTSAYLASVAQDAGFKGRARTEPVRANVPVTSDGSIILIDKAHKVVAGVDFADNLKPLVGDLMEVPNLPQISVLNTSADKNFYLRIIKRVQNVQSDDIIGHVVAIRKLDKDFFALLTFPPAGFVTSATELYRKHGSVLEPVSEKPSANVIAMQANNDLAQIYAVSNPDVIAEKNDNKGNKMLVTAKELGAPDLFMVHSISYKEAFAEARTNLRHLRTMSYLFVLMLGAIMLFVWKHSTSEKFRKLLKELQEKTRLLEMITRNQIQSMFLINEENNVAFGNRVFERKNKIKDESEFKDKPLENVVGKAAADEYLGLAIRAQESNEPVSTLNRHKVAGKERFVQQKAIPINDISMNGYFKGALIIENDISELINERVKYEQNLSNSIEILVRIIENRSQYFHNHGQQVHDLSVMVSDSLGVQERHRRAVDFASRISNLSLALLPRDIINKQGELTKEEKEMFNSVPQKTIAIVKDFNFDSPVIETLEQMNEHIDGTGPLKLKGEQIAISARIIKVVNDYVAMTSPRPYRDKLTPEQAIENLLKGKDSKYSKEVVFALANIVSRHK